MKTVYINESMVKLLKESVLMSTLPAAIRTSVSRSPYGGLPLFNGNEAMTKAFIDRAMTSEFDRAKTVLKNMGQIDSVDANTVEDAFQKIVLRCQKLEEPNRDALERIAVNYVIDLFGIPDDMLKIEARLVPDIEGAEDLSPIEPFDGDVDFETEDLDDLSNINMDVAKRHIINALNMGAGMRISENVRGYLEDLYDIDSRLPQLYKEAMSLNNYMIFRSPELGITDKTRNQIGLVNVKYGPSDELVTISVQATIFPVLLCELVRGLMELFSSHGLPKATERTEYILKKADYLKAEPWQMRIGPYLWEKFTSLFENSDTSDMPYIYKVVSSLEPVDFFNVVSEMLAGTKKGKAYAKRILSMAVNDKEMVGFTDKMNKRKTDKSVITDGYMSPEEF